VQALFTDSFTLLKNVLKSPETTVTAYQATWHNKPEGFHLLAPEFYISILAHPVCKM
jgi:hypothetical protein